MVLKLICKPPKKCKNLKRAITPIRSRQTILTFKLFKDLDFLIIQSVYVYLLYFERKCTTIEMDENRHYGALTQKSSCNFGILT